MQVYLDGQFISETEAHVGVFDRGFLYGDGLFETMRVVEGRVAHWEAHWTRLKGGLEQLRIPAPASDHSLVRTAAELLRRNGVLTGLLRLQITRGAGRRGCSPRGATSPTLLLSTHALPDGAEAVVPPRWRVITARRRIWSQDPLHNVKSCNQLSHVLARVEADEANADEALLLNERGEVVETTSANLFWIAAGRLLTPPVAAGALPGITRGRVLSLAAKAGLPVAETVAPTSALLKADAVFLTNSAWGPVAVVALDGHELRTAPQVADLRARWLADLTDDRAGELTNTRQRLGSR